MAWAPSNTFEDEFIDLQTDFNFIYGQRAYELKRQQELAATSDPRPNSTYEYLAKRERRNEELELLHGTTSNKSREIRSSLSMMERIQHISGTKPLGEHATMSDWDNTSTVEHEAIAMMRHFGMMCLTEGTTLAPPKEDQLPKGKFHLMRNGRQTFPLILDPNYFVPRKTRPSAHTIAAACSSDSTSYSTCNANITLSSENSSNYYSAKSCLDTSASTQEEDSVIPVRYQLLVESPYDSSESELKEVMLNQIKIKKNRRKKRSLKKQSEKNSS